MLRLKSNLTVLILDLKKVYKICSFRHIRLTFFYFTFHCYTFAQLHGYSYLIKACSSLHLLGQNCQHFDCHLIHVIPLIAIYRTYDLHLWPPFGLIYRTQYLCEWDTGFRDQLSLCNKIRHSMKQNNNTCNNIVTDQRSFPSVPDSIGCITFPTDFKVKMFTLVIPAFKTLNKRGLPLRIVRPNFSGVFHAFSLNYQFQIFF